MVYLNLAIQFHVLHNRFKKMCCLLRHFLGLFAHEKTAWREGLVEHPDDVNALRLIKMEQYVFTEDQAEIIPDRFKRT